MAATLAAARAAPFLGGCQRDADATTQWEARGAEPQAPPTASSPSLAAPPRSSVARRSVRTRSSPSSPLPSPRRPLSATPAGVIWKEQRNTASSIPMCQEEFELACAAIKELKGPVSDEEKLLVYSYYKQATQGDCNIPAPPDSDVIAKAKWEAWNVHKGMSKMDAMRVYTVKVKELKKKEAG